MDSSAANFLGSRFFFLLNVQRCSFLIPSFFPSSQTSISPSPSLRIFVKRPGTEEVALPTALLFTRQTPTSLLGTEAMSFFSLNGTIPFCFFVSYLPFLFCGCDAASLTRQSSFIIRRFVNAFPHTFFSPLPFGVQFPFPPPSLMYGSLGLPRRRLFLFGKQCFSLIWFAQS